LYSIAVQDNDISRRRHRAKVEDKQDISSMGARKIEEITAVKY